MREQFSDERRDKAGLAFEKRVAQLYRLAGADVKHNVNIDGHQIDLLVTIRSHGVAYRNAIECKNWKDTVGRSVVTEFGYVCGVLKGNYKIEKGIIIAKEGFTQDAHSTAAAAGIELLTLEELKRALIDFDTYCNEFAEDYQYSELFRRDCYVPLGCLDENGRDLGTVDEYLSSWLENREKHLTLLGDYGAGKTTAVKRLVWKLARNILDGDTTARVPVYVNLRDYTRRLTLRSLITDMLVNEYRIGLSNYETFKELNRDGQFVIVLDGFDEMATHSDYDTTEKNFEEVLKLIDGQSKTILTCRTHYFKDDMQVHKLHEGTMLYKKIDKAGYRLLHLKSFDQGQVIQYLKQWFGSDWEKYHEEIQRVYNLSELATKPILLELMAKTLPEMLAIGDSINAANLYRTYVDFWLRRDDWRTVMSHDQRQGFSGALAEHLYVHNLPSVHYREIPQIIATMLPETRSADLHDFEEDVRTCTFLKRDEKGNYHFIHKSFLEFFVADRLVQQLRNGGFTGFDKLLSRQIWGFLCELLKESDEIAIDQEIKRFQDRSTLRYGNLLQALFHTGRQFAHSDLSQIQWESAYLPGICLTEADLRGTRIVRSNLSNCDATNADFGGAYLRLTNLDRSNLENACFENCDLENATFEFSTLAGASFKESNMQGVRLSSANINSVDLSNCDLSHANLSYTDLRSATLSSANLVGTVMTKANLAGMVMEGRNLQGASFEDAKLDAVHFIESDLSHASFDKTTSADLRLTRCTMDNLSAKGAVLENLALVQPKSCDRIDFAGAAIARTTLSGLQLNRAKLNNCRLDDFTLSQCTFVEPEMSGIRMSRAKITDCRFDDCTVIDGVILESVSFEEVHMSGVLLRGVSFSDCEVRNSKWPFLTFQSSSSLANVVFHRCDLTNCIWQDCRLNMVKFVDSNLSKCRFERCKIDPLTERHLVTLRKKYGFTISGGLPS